MNQAKSDSITELNEMLKAIEDSMEREIHTIKVFWINNSNNFNIFSKNMNKSVNQYWKRWDQKQELPACEHDETTF